jgi:hypothetical protein
MNEIDEYLRTNRDAYTREALTRRLVESGHDPAEVDAAWARLELANGGARPRPRGSGGRPGIGTYLLIGATVLGYCYVAALGVGGVLFMAYYGSPGTSSYSAASVILIAVYLIGMVVGLGYSVRRLHRAPSLATGGWAFGPALAISLVVFVGINGACVVGALAGSLLGAL